MYSGGATTRGGMGKNQKVEMQSPSVRVSDFWKQRCKIVRLLSGLGRFWFETGEHKGHKMIPVIEWQIVQESSHMLEEGTARWKPGTYGAIFQVKPVECCMHQEGHEDHSRQKIGQMFFPMSEAVLEMVALGFQRVVIFVLYFPSCATCGR